MNNSERVKKIGEWAKKNLVEYMLPFWTCEHIVDRENGGFYGCVTLDLKIDNDRPRGLTFTGRQLYALSTAYLHFPNPIYKERAEWTFREIQDRFYDKEFGGGFTTVDKDKNVIQDNKSLYCMAFIVMGCAAYYHATGDKEAYRIAMETFNLVETKMKLGPCQYEYNMTRDWKKAPFMGGHGNGQKTGSMQLSDDAVIFPHHMYQAYLRLYQATGDQRVADALREMTVYFADVMYNPQYRCLRPTQYKWHEPVPGQRQSFGHDCEISYLAVEIAELVGDEELQKKVKAEVADMLDRLESECYDPYGALVDIGDYECHPIPGSHVWWAQAESVTAMFCGYELTGEERYLDACERQIEYIEKYFINRVHGDWYSDVVVDHKGWRLIEGQHGFDKLNAGKCPFHNGQMSFELMERTARELTKMSV